jgi:hypothetical protein
MYEHYMNNPADIKSALQILNGNEFEEFTALVWSAMGWSVEVTESSRDKGVDVIATKSRMVDEKVVIQSKCYSSGNKVGGPEIQQYSSLHKQIPDADKVIVVTSSDFTSDAIALADQLNVDLVDGDDLVEACLEFLTKEQVEHFFQNSAVSLQYSRSGENITPDSVSIDNFSKSEEDLTEIYKGYLHRLENSKGRQFRRLIFDVSRGKDSEEDAYIVKGLRHYLRIYPTNKELVYRIEETAEKYGWHVDGKNIACRESIRSDIHDTVSAEFSIIINPVHRRDSVSPRRQAKITSLLISTVYNQELSGTKLREIAMGRADEAPTAVIE